MIKKSCSTTRICEKCSITLTQFIPDIEILSEKKEKDLNDQIPRFCQCQECKKYCHENEKVHYD